MLLYHYNGHMETYYMPEDEKSLFGLKAQYVAMASYIILIAYRIYRTMIFIINSAYLEDFGLLDKITAFFSTYYDYSELFLALLPIAIILLERKSKIVRFHCFQSLFTNLVLPLIYRLVVLLLGFAMMVIVGDDDLLLLLSYVYWIITLYGIMTVFTTFVAVHASYCAYKGHTNNFPLFSSFTILSALYSKIVTVETAQTLLKRKRKKDVKEADNH